MQVSSINHTNTYNLIQQTKTHNVSFEVKQSNSADPILEYYHNLCKQYPDITFRLGDIETGLQTNSKSIGYKNSLHQVGENYGANGQCSITIDVSSIRRMIEDPSYEIGVKASIEEAQKKYPQYELDTKACGMNYTDVVIEDDNGKIQYSVGHFPRRFSTEEELLAMRAESNTESYADTIKKQIAENTDMFDSLMEMLDKSQEKQRELAKKYYELNNGENTNKNVKDELLRKRAVDEYDKHILTA